MRIAINSFYLLQSICQLLENISRRLLIPSRFLLPMKPFLHKSQDRGDELHLIYNTDEHRLNWENILFLSFTVMLYICYFFMFQHWTKWSLVLTHCHAFEFSECFVCIITDFFHRTIVIKPASSEMRNILIDQRGT